MTLTPTNTDLSGKLLIAMPGMSDPRFDKSVVYLCAHSDDGAMGLIVNKPAQDIALEDLLEQLGIDGGEQTPKAKIYFGGPVETGRGFVLHSGDYPGNEATLKVDETFSMTATRDVLEDIACGKGPSATLAALGYAGWGPGQLEGELQQNAWLICDADQAIVFAADVGGKWSAALAKLGIDPLMLSAEGGRA
ncbi:YqgE/AlgH family protein [Aliiroseovarius subalbicans]|uniref:YqgE/AlgH family protein n=1 Tax=Aliiroseovarius subalbicans TaxID=2925840 RepID=UPI001F5745F8|nr:YqgE/AlgH family protein [Aliiroseovarius subalbicans]MCI2399566.1 YqgE/AlgH family protein [Aliiroseovarius subalbicans]